VTQWQPIEARKPDYCFDPSNWECTYDWGDWNLMVDDADADSVVEIATLYKGPSKWATRAVEDDEWAWRLFDTKEKAEAARTAYQAWLNGEPPMTFPVETQAGQGTDEETK
jgi:hypothetical protein